MTLTQDTRPGQGPMLTLSGRVNDRGALAGALDGLLDRGLLLLSVESLGAEPVE